MRRLKELIAAPGALDAVGVAYEVLVHDVTYHSAEEAPSDATPNSPLNDSTTRNVLQPIEPVEPKIAICFISNLQSQISNLRLPRPTS